MSVIVDAEHDAEHDAGPPRRLTMPTCWAIGVAVAIARWSFSHDRRMFHMAPDEPAQLAMARWLAGGARWNMFDHSSWRPGMAMLIAPLFRLTDDAATIIRGGLIIGATLGGIAAVLLARLGLRLTTLPPRQIAVASVAIAVTASSLSATAFVWAESLVTVCFLAALTQVLAFYDEPRLSPGLQAVGWSVAGFTAHSRMLPLVAVVACVLVARAVLGRAWRLAATLLSAAAAGTAASYLFVDHVFDSVWDDPASSNTVDTVWKRLPKLDDNLRSAVGQVWYQLVATAGVAMIGIAVLAWRSLRRDPASHRLVRRDARLMLAVTLPMIVVSIVFMSGRVRADHQIYGRYNDAIVWPVLLVGVAWLLQLRRTRHRLLAVGLLAATAGAVIGASVSVQRLVGETLADSIGVRPMIAGLVPYMGRTDAVDVTRVAIGALVAFVVIAGAALLDRRLLLAVAVVGLVWGGVRTHTAMTLRLNSWEPALAVREIDTRIPADATIGFRFVLAKDKPSVSWDDQRRRAQLYQFALPDHRFERDRGVDDAVGPYVFAPKGDPALVDAGAKVVWEDPEVNIVLWQEPIRSA